MTASVRELTLRGVSVEQGGRRLVESVDATVLGGARIAVTGPSGAGKTTLLRAVAGLIDPSAGEIALDRTTAEERGWPEWRRAVLYVAQTPVLFPGTVEQNLRRPFQYRASEREFSVENARQQLAAVGLADSHWRQEARSLSAGEQQRVALVRALLLESEVLLLDEPTAALDADSVRAVEEVLIAWTDDERAILFVSHDPIQVERLSTAAIEPWAAGEDE